MNEQPAPSRILEIARDQLTDEQKAGLEALIKGRGRILAPYKVWVHSPELLRAMEQLGTFLNKRSSLSEREIELAICLIAVHWAGEYVFAAHAARCLALGYSPAVIEAIRITRSPSFQARASVPSTRSRCRPQSPARARTSCSIVRSPLSAATASPS